MLGLDLAILGDSLRFLVGQAELPGSDDLIRRLQGTMVSLEAKAQEAEDEAERARVEERASALLMVLRVRGIPVTQAERDRILVERDGGCLAGWLEKAVTAGSLAEVLADSGREPD